jgi:hypothetical protein
MTLTAYSIELTGTIRAPAEGGSREKLTASWTPLLDQHRRIGRAATGGAERRRLSETYSFDLIRDIPAKVFPALLVRHDGILTTSMFPDRPTAV